MRVGSLCTGYGGLEMGLRMVFPQARMVWCADNDKAASALLAARYPGVPNLGDVTAVDWSLVEDIDVLAAGIPCQPHSLAGKRLNPEEDERDLVDTFINAVRVLRPSVVILENVPGFKRYGLPRVLGALAALGFDARWHSVRASEAGAPHRRERVLVLAVDPNRESWKQWRIAAGSEEEGGRPWADAGRSDRVGDQDTPDAYGAGREGSRQEADASGTAAAQVDWREYGPAIWRWEAITGQLAPPPIEVAPKGNVRLAVEFPEWMMGVPPGHVTGLGFSRRDALRLIGNGVVPLQAALGIDGLIREETDCASVDRTRDRHDRAA